MDIQLKKRRFPISRKTITIIAIAAGVAIAVMIGDGCCAFVSISLGQNEVPKARRSVGNESGEGVAAHRRRDARSV